jgi:hypothetical protein
MSIISIKNKLLYWNDFKNGEKNKNKKKERKKRFRIGHGIRHDRQATASSRQSNSYRIFSISKTFLYAIFWQKTGKKEGKKERKSGSE